MKSATAITYELDDIQAAAQELLQQIHAKLELAHEGVGILYIQPKMESAQLSAILHQELGFPIIGGTTAGAAMISNGGHHELAIMLQVLTAEDCTFSAAMSPSMANQPKQCIIDTYQRALYDLTQKDATAQPQMAFCVTSILQSYSSDDGLDALSEVSHALPIFGFVAADDFQFSHQQVVLNGACGHDVIAILLIAGNIKPIFEVKNLAGSHHFSKRKITRAHDNVICEIDNMPAYEYLKDFPFISDDSTVLWNYQFFVEMRNESDDDGVPVSRALNTYDKVSGEITCFANVPENSYIGLQYCDDKDVKASCQTALEEIKAKVAAASTDEYTYSTILIASCSLRNMFLADQKDAEGSLAAQILPDTLQAAGVYGFGEIAPTSLSGGKAVNRFHNATMIICAL